MLKNSSSYSVVLIFFSVTPGCEFVFLWYTCVLRTNNRYIIKPKWCFLIWLCICDILFCQKSAQFLQKELPIRVARRVVDFQKLPHIALCNPVIHDMVGELCTLLLSFIYHIWIRNNSNVKIQWIRRETRFCSHDGRLTWVWRVWHSLTRRMVIYWGNVHVPWSD